MIRRLPLAFVVLTLLAGCGGDKSPQGDGRTASGEVLQGSISDDMLPLDTLTSQAPPMKEQPKAAPAASPAEAAPAASPTEAAAPASDPIGDAAAPGGN